MKDESFRRFREEHPLWARAYDGLAEKDEVLALSARTVLESDGDRLARTADEILGFVDRNYPPGWLDLYVQRVEELNRGQRRFDESPSLETLGDASRPVDRDRYDLALLLSIVFSKHRFDIMTHLRQFLSSVRAPAGDAAAIGIGTGYETMLLARALRGWSIEGFDTDPRSRETARRLLAHFDRAEDVTLGERFPLDSPGPGREARYDAIVFCEILEHLEDPLTALRTLRRCLRPRGRMFVTMAINIAQEDHVFWYPDIASCERQLAQAQLTTVLDWVAPMTVAPGAPGEDPRRGFVRGNYVAVVAPG